MISDGWATHIKRPLKFAIYIQVCAYVHLSESPADKIRNIASHLALPIHTRRCVLELSLLHVRVHTIRYNMPQRRAITSVPNITMIRNWQDLYIYKRLLCTECTYSYVHLLCHATPQQWSDKILSWLGECEWYVISVWN